MKGAIVSAADLRAFLSSSVPLFTDLPSDRLDQLVAGSRTATFEPGEAIVEFGEEGRFMGVVLDGEAEVSVTDDTGRKHRIALLGPGDVFGEMSLMTGDRTMADVIGVSRCRALLIPQALFSALLVTHPPAIRRLSKTISERVRASAFEDQRRSREASAEIRSQDPYGFSLRSEIPMRVLVVNCGSSSLKYAVFETGNPAAVARGAVERIGTDGTRHAMRHGERERAWELPAGTHRDAFQAMVDGLSGCGVLSSAGDIGAVGHRVVHGGERFPNAALITDEVLDGIRELAALAPLHNPVNLAGIEAARSLLPAIPHVAVFDTSYHHTLPPYAYLYGLPYELYERLGVRRYGFHGTSHFYVSLKAAEFLKRPYNELEIVSCHLGNGASVCAIDHGRSVDTSMGLTPVEGLVMGTRCGDIDAGALVHLMRTEKLDADQVEDIINRQSGLKGLSGVSSDMREVEDAAAQGVHGALLALKTFCYRVRKYIGAYAAAMGGIDALVFTGGIGQGSPGVRMLACQGLEWMGIAIDEAANRDADKVGVVTDISAAGSSVRVLVAPTDEEHMIARETLRTLDRQYITTILEAQRNVPIPVEVSAHHVHLCPADVEALFGKGHTLTPKAELSQPGQYACEEVVALVGPKGRVERVRVLGPTRSQTQVEIAMTEQFKLGIHPPIRESGDLANTPGITLEGPAGSITLAQGVICALRHVHMGPEDALRFGLRDKYVVRM
ncbi:MAG: acetate/propionate family kinase, partial [Chitinivibrionales bacterium]|nr:acetate/propionate family kinase [Chitinivibrionales bacterium]